MNAFEDIVAYYFEEEGYWVRKSVKVNISKEENKVNWPAFHAEAGDRPRRLQGQGKSPLINQGQILS
ncbi:hypothetical protein TAMC210_02680 [Thermanaeromonas sp. C210]|nr:hypothetical protein TAMC210_02680 [Thermanaeromonas sp. C210]